MSEALSLTSLLAFYGAAPSSIGFGWNVYRDLLDKPPAVDGFPAQTDSSPSPRAR
jgi:hypothetical protein